MDNQISPNKGITTAVRTLPVNEFNTTDFKHCMLSVNKCHSRTSSMPNVQRPILPSFANAKVLILYLKMGNQQTSMLKRPAACINN